MDGHLIVSVDSTRSEMTVIRLTGDLDIFTVDDFTGRAGEEIGEVAEHRLVVDLHELEFCDSSGVNALVRLWQRARKAGGTMVLMRVPVFLRDKLAYTGLGRLLAPDC